jgi:hypothetical protein
VRVGDHSSCMSKYECTSATRWLFSVRFLLSLRRRLRARGGRATREHGTIVRAPAVAPAAAPAFTPAVSPAFVPLDDIAGATAPAIR